MSERSRAFSFDVASPYSYIAVARIEGLIADVMWQPILVGVLPRCRTFGAPACPPLSPTLARAIKAST
ncbi:MAG: hypothetical protein M3Y09_02615 [Actinomycetota bacterium]|nr:hypothetical protein [Actinomycetota bacterium]